MPNAVKTIKKEAFHRCSGFTTVTLDEGLEEMGYKAFYKCTSLEFIVIPRTVKEIHQSAFNQCSHLTNVEFCADIQAFVSCAAMCDWWHQGDHYRCLSTYCFFVKFSIPNRLALMRVRSWQANV
jgi:hypothetical protein